MPDPAAVSPEDEHYMRQAIAAARRGVAQGQTPFGAVIVDASGRIAADNHNRVWLTQDPTAHAEVTAVREAAGFLKSIDFSGCTIYSTVEPCPMCFTAIHWARIDRIVYGASIADAADFGFNELHVSNTHLKETGGSPVEICSGVLKDESLDVFREWISRPDSRTY